MTMAANTSPSSGGLGGVPAAEAGVRSSQGHDSGLQEPTGTTGAAAAATLPPPPSAGGPVQDTTTTTTNNNNNNNPIRHAGMALIRGKFRRVWRPRYLEVRDNGWLSYYECPPLTPPPNGTAGGPSALDVFVDPSTLVSESQHQQSMMTTTINTTTMVESSSHSGSNGQPQQHYHSRIPKCTLWIHHARIIDPTTLRDMHVGLPRGSYGFLFHGHRIDSDYFSDQIMMIQNQHQQQNSITNNNSLLSSFGGGLVGGVVVGVVGGENDQQQQHSSDLLNDGLQLLSMAQTCQGNAIDATPRDFLCAVDSLEEAQSWVVALQWAASMGRDSSFQYTTPTPLSFTNLSALLPPSTTATAAIATATTPSSEDGSLSVSTSFANASQRQQQQQLEQQSPESVKTLTAASEAAVATTSPSAEVSSVGDTVTPPRRPKQQQQQPSSVTKNNNGGGGSAGKMVVTKVVGYTLVRLEKWKWEIAYQIQVLLVMPNTNNPKDAAAGAEDGDRNSTPQVQEWSILRTVQDLELIVDQLRVSSSLPADIGQKVLDPQLQRIALLPRLHSTTDSKSAASTSNRRRRQVPTTATEVSSNSVAIFDSILRSFCMEATVVNSSVVKRFLGVHSPSSSSAAATNIMVAATTSTKQKEINSFWEIHNSTGLRTFPLQTILHHQTIDQYVKEWLKKDAIGGAGSAGVGGNTAAAAQQQQQQQRPSLKFRLLCWLLRRLPSKLNTTATYVAGVVVLLLLLTIGGGSGGVTGLLASMNRLVRKYQILPYVTVRIDALLFSWLLAFGIGRLAAAFGELHPTKSGTTARSGSSVIRKRVEEPSKQQQPQQQTITMTPPATAPSTPQISSTKSDLRKEAALRMTGTPNKSLIDEDDSQEMVVEEDGEEDRIDEAGVAATNSSQGQEVNEPSFLLQRQDSRLSSPLPRYSTAKDITQSCWSTPKDHIFHVRGPNYLTDRVKIPSGDASFACLGVDLWLTDFPQRQICRHPSVMGGQLARTDQDIFMVNFLLPFGNFVSYFAVPPLDKFASPQLAGVWTRFIQGDQQYRDARLKLLPVVVEGPWIVRAAVPGTSPALLGKVIPLQYFFTQKANGRSIYEVDVIITASSIAKGILSVVKGHAKALSIAFAFIIEAAEEHELPETVLASFQVNSLHLEDCPLLPDCNLDSLTMP